MPGYLRHELSVLPQAARLRDRVSILRLALHEHLHFGRGRRFGHVLPARQREFDLHLADGGPEISLRMRNTDFSLFEIFAQRSCDVDLAPLGRVRTVLDLGANAGFATAFLAQRLPSARFICVEPAPDTFRLLEENLRRNVPDAIAIRAAAVGAPGAHHLKMGARPGLNRVAAGTGSPDATVESLTIPQILDRAGVERVDLAKIDVEGGEVGLLERASEWADRVGAVLAETHAPLTPADAMEQLSAHGFTPLALPEREIFDWRQTVYAKRIDAPH